MPAVTALLDPDGCDRQTAGVRCSLVVRTSCFALLLAGCGDNTLPVGAPLLHSRDLTIVAHSEDDLVYLQPDQLQSVIRDGATIAYLTDGRVDSRNRHSGIMAAYTAATGDDGWQCGWMTISGRAVEHCRLEDAHLSLVFFGYPEGDPDGTSPTSIARLWDGTIDVALTIGDVIASYRRDDVIETLTALIDATQPRTIRTMDIAGVHGDHADHAITGAATLLAVATLPIYPEIISFRASGTEAEPATLIDPLFDRSAGLLAYFDACVEGRAECGTPASSITDEHAIALRRRYATSMRLAGGELRLGQGCVAADSDGGLSVGTCPTTEPWRLAADGTLHVGARCVETLLFNGELIAGNRCDLDASHRFFLDDEGHLWTGAPPPIAPGGALQCVALIGGRPRATRCGPALAPRWEMSPNLKVTPHPIGLPTGRAVRLADIDNDRHADLCAIIGTKLACALGDGAGGFGALAIRTTLAIEPESLVIGDVDGDGIADACGRDASGLLCATASANFVAERWSPAFAHGGPPDASDHSLAAVDSDGNGSAEICGLTFDGIACAQHDLAALPPLRSPWPAKATAVWPGDLDGDRRADWCALSGGIAVCGLDSLSSVTTDGVPWSFSLNGIGDVAPLDTNLGAVGDIDGDGRTDLCGIDANLQITCARSQGFGFGPVAIFATVISASSQTGLWLGDLDGDGKADACADDGTDVHCALSH